MMPLPLSLSFIMKSSTRQRSAVWYSIVVFVWFCVCTSWAETNWKTKTVNSHEEVFGKRLKQPRVTNNENHQLEESTAASTTPDNKGEPMETSCRLVGECEMCLSQDKEACEATGRRQRYQCETFRGGEKVDEEQTYRSCSRTQWDEEYLMIRMQVFCVLLGSLSLMSVRKQKILSASLFDQRKASFQKRKNTATTIEMGSVATTTTASGSTSGSTNNDLLADEERVPLTRNDDSIDIV